MIIKTNAWLKGGSTVTSRRDLSYAEFDLRIRVCDDEEVEALWRQSAKTTAIPIALELPDKDWKQRALKAEKLLAELRRTLLELETGR